MWVVRRARLPSSGMTIRVVVDDQSLTLMPEARDFATYLVGAGKAAETLRAYIPRVAHFLNWADQAPDCDWRSVTLKQMQRYKWSLEAPYSHPRGPKVRASSTVDNYLTAVLEFLRFCARSGLVQRDLMTRFFQPKYLGYMPASFDAGENGEYRYALVKELRTRSMPEPPKRLAPAQMAAVRKACRNARDAFLIELLDSTAVRIGEALGLRRADMHLLPDSTPLGCEVPGAHVHVRRRWDNENGVFTKSRAPRYVPVGEIIAKTYTDYQHARAKAQTSVDSDHVLVNLYGGEVGAAMTYSNTIKLIVRLGRRAGIDGLHPHLFRHTTASRWADDGIDAVVLQELLGHAVAASTQVYLHPSYERLRRVVDRTEQAQKERRK